MQKLKLNNIFTNLIFIKVSVLFLILVSFSPMFFSFIGPSYEISINDNKYKSCINFNEKNIDFKNIEILEKDIYIFPEINNLKCIGKIVEFNDGTNETLFYGTNKKLFNYFNVLFSVVIVFLNFLILKKNNYLSYKIFSILSFSIFSFQVNKLFDVYFNFKQLFVSFEIFISFFSTILFVSNLIFRSNNLILFTLLFFSFFNYEYFGIYIIVLLYISKKELTLNNFQKKIFLSFPLIFYLSRFIASFNEKFNKFWMIQFQESYYGFSRFIDFQGDFFLLSCNGNNNINYQVRFKETILRCPEIYGYGPLRKFLVINTDIWITTLTIAALVLILTLITYKLCLNSYPENYFFITLIFISPPVMLVIHHMNPDIFFLCSIFLINKKVKNTNVKNCILFIFSLWKIHIVGIFIGQLIFSIFYKKTKKVNSNLFFLLLTALVYFIDTKVTEPLKIPPAPDENWSFGILSDIEQISLLLSIESTKVSYTFYFLVMFICLAIGYKFRNYFLNNVSLKMDYEVYGYIFWFFLCMVYRNQTYRLSLFIFLFVLLMVSSNNLKFNNLFLFTFFLNPIFSTHLEVSKYLTLILNRIGIYFIFILLISLIFEEFFKKIFYEEKFPKVKNFYNK